MEFDTVFVVPCDPGPRLEKFAETLYRTHWPGLLYTAFPQGVIPQLTAWGAEPANFPLATGELSFVRDLAMDTSWDEQGYYTEHDGEGPFSIFYQRLPASELEVDVRRTDASDPQIAYRYGVACLWSPVWSGVTLVSGADPAESSWFSTIVELLKSQFVEAVP